MIVYFPVEIITFCLLDNHDIISVKFYDVETQGGTKNPNEEAGAEVGVAKLFQFTLTQLFRMSSVTTCISH